MKATKNREHLESKKEYEAIFCLHQWNVGLVTSFKLNPTPQFLDFLSLQAMYRA